MPILSCQMILAIKILVTQRYPHGKLKNLASFGRKSTKLRIFDGVNPEIPGKPFSPPELTNPVSISDRLVAVLFFSHLDLSGDAEREPAAARVLR
jgi:hypothetical protein